MLADESINLTLIKYQAIYINKDCVPRFKEGVRQQMEKQKKGTTHNWYQNLEQNSVASRKVKTASGKRNRRVQIQEENLESQAISQPVSIQVSSIFLIYLGTISNRRRKAKGNAENDERSVQRPY